MTPDLKLDHRQCSNIRYGEIESKIEAHGWWFPPPIFCSQCDLGVFHWISGHSQDRAKQVVHCSYFRRARNKKKKSISVSRFYFHLQHVQSNVDCHRIQTMALNYSFIDLLSGTSLTFSLLTSDKQDMNIQRLKKRKLMKIEHNCKFRIIAWTLIVCFIILISLIYHPHWINKRALAWLKNWWFHPFCCKSATHSSKSCVSQLVSGSILPIHFKCTRGSKKMI